LIDTTTILKSKNNLLLSKVFKVPAGADAVTWHSTSCHHEHSNSGVIRFIRNALQGT